LAVILENLNVFDNGLMSGCAFRVGPPAFNIILNK